MKKRLLFCFSLIALISLLFSSCLFLPFIWEEDVLDEDDNGIFSNNNDGNDTNLGSNDNAGAGNTSNTDTDDGKARNNYIFKLNFTTGNNQQVASKTQKSKEEYFSIDDNTFTCFDKNDTLLRKDGYVFAGWSLNSKYSSIDYVNSNQFTAEVIKNEENKTMFFWSSLKNECTESIYSQYTNPVISGSTIEYSLNFYGIWIPESKFFALETVDSNFNKAGSENFDNTQTYNKLVATDFKSYSPIELTIPSKINNLNVEAIDSDYFGFSKVINLPKTLKLFSLNSRNVTSCIERFNISDENESFRTIEGVLYSADKKILYYFPNRKDASNWALPETVKTINSYAFAYSNIEQINLENVKTIGHWAFAYSNLIKIAIPTDVVYTSKDTTLLTQSGNYFAFCSKLKTAVIYKNDIIQILPERMFYECTRLKTVDIRTTVTSTGNGVFSLCENLEEIKYIGTKEEWNAIKFGEEVFNKCNDIKISCSNGEIIKTTEPKNN